VHILHDPRLNKGTVYGSPFPGVEWEGRRHPIAQADNAYVFPGIGLGIVACGIRRVTDGLFLAAADALAAATTSAELEQGEVYPPIARIRDVSLAVAEAVGRQGYSEGVASVPDSSRVREHVHRSRYDPAYPAG
jgi:malic enzyme